ncbi:MAG: HAD family hydrolase [Desulfovermiculus sp.]|nr:HAD family hydrolase [Desulfovermiculus sp.]
MVLAIFDLDSTLLNGDSDHAWGEFIAEKGLVGRKYQEENDRFYQDYLAGRLDVTAYIEFMVQPLLSLDIDQLEELRQEFIQTRIQPMRLPKAEALLADHRRQGRTLIIITSTTRIITEPIARLLGVEHLLATDLEVKNRYLTGKLSGIPCFGPNKVIKLQEWMQATGNSLEDSYCYSDSHTDLPLLELVEHPVAVDPDQALEHTARSRDWPVISLR